jgi:HPt (histidine-containing phosphotransfer) domain-containing protein
MFLEMGFNDYISKPIEIVKLDEIIARWIPLDKQIKAGRGIKRESFSGKTNIVISGVDTQKGISLTGGTEAGYRKVLAQFYKDAQERLGVLKNFIDDMNPVNADKFSEKNLAAFTTQVHALKSASASIGAVELSLEAAAFETAGKAAGFPGRAAAITKALPAFVERLTALVEGIGAALETPAGPAEGGAAASAESAANAATDSGLFPLLRELAEALQSQKAAAVDRLLEELSQKPLDGKTREALEAVSDDVLMTEYGKALETVTALLENKK